MRIDLEVVNPFGVSVRSRGKETVDRMRKGLEGDISNKTPVVSE